uniref:Islet cell autoantigen Ica1 C-terminal domain-containing protein n=1 Tax=Photinus pyralis TaxID=7054 RepID=A0A1Y1M9J6_PHOPY
MSNLLNFQLYRNSRHHKTRRRRIKVHFLMPIILIKSRRKRHKKLSMSLHIPFHFSPCFVYRTTSRDASEVSNLLGEDFTPSMPESKAPAMVEDKALTNLALLEMNISSEADLLGDFMPSRLMQEENFFNLPEQFDSVPNNNIPSKLKGNEKTEAQVSWLSLFKELDPLANQDLGSGDKL